MMAHHAVSLGQHKRGMRWWPFYLGFDSGFYDCSLLICGVRIHVIGEQRGRAVFPIAPYRTAVELGVCGHVSRRCSHKAT